MVFYSLVINSFFFIVHLISNFVPTNKFFTIIWTLYFPLCMVFYDTTSKLQYSDEILTLILIMFTLTKLKRTSQLVTKEAIVCVLLMAFYTVYSLVRAVNVSSSVWLDLQQQIRPYAVFYCTWLLHPQFTRSQKRMMLWVMVVSFLFYVLAFEFSPGLVTRYSYNHEESVILGQLAMTCAMTIYFFKPQSKKTLFYCLIVMALGLLGGKAKFLGEMVVFVALFWFLKERIKLGSVKTIIQFVVITATVIFFTWTKFNGYYIEGMSNDSELMARPASYKTAYQIVTKDYVPFGSGLGTFATNAAATYYSPLYYDYNLSAIWGLSPEFTAFMADAYYPTLAEFGLVGILFFILFWRRRILAVLKLPDVRHYKVGLMCIAALALESVSDTSYLSGKGMGYFMLLALCLSTARADIYKRKMKS